MILLQKVYNFKIIQILFRKNDQKIYTFIKEELENAEY